MANKKIDKSNLGYLGIDFQYKLIKSFMDDHTLFNSLHKIIDQNMFTDSNLRLYVGVMKEYYEKYNDIPSYSVMEINLREKSFSEIDIQMQMELIHKIQNTPMDGIDDIKEIAKKFFRQQNFIRAASTILKKAGDGDLDNYDECFNILEETLNVGKDENVGIKVFENTDETLSDDYRCTIPTGVKAIDDILEGGIGKGELGVIIGGSSFGKTSLTTAMSAHAASYKCFNNGYQGFKVLQIVFEDKPKQLRRKYIARISGVEAKDLSKPEYIDYVKEKLKEREEEVNLINENVYIVRYPSGELTATGLKKEITKIINKGFRPDLVILDYFECLAEERMSASANEWKSEGKAMRKLENMASEFDFGLWVATQGTKDSINGSLVTMDKASGSFTKMQVAHIIMSIARTMEEIERNIANIAILKNRSGKAGRVFNNIDFNNGTCIISSDNVVDFNSAMEYEDARKKKEYTERLNIGKGIMKEIKEQENK